jgi:hypothetical protein
VFHLKSPGSFSSFPVRRIYFLDSGKPTDEFHIRTQPLQGLSTVALLNSNSFLRHWGAGKELRQINLERSSSIASVMPVHRLVRPLSLDRLSELVDFVEEDVAGLA